ncbi:MAG TPA: type II secretion system F family protein [Candidatus Omnitrophota bacterium]|nr:type II secretion system F family protein [Candidatus Omnitrophota bacterium]HOX09004.1 type II secretion system F family protein [Candidatus Omnitrophota bacterium]HRZ66910.1 type II secretion system F family protein [Candidatus Omnitrophota bacterium]
MAIFNYVAIDKDGKETKGKLEVAGNQEAMDQIRQKGLYPISITEEKSKSDMTSSRERGGSADVKPAKSVMTISLFGRVTAKQVTIFTRQLATLIGSGLPLVRALYVLERQEKAGLLKATIRGLAEQVEGGSSFSEALSKFPKAFEPLYVNTVKAGEAGGVLEVVLTRLAEFAEKSQRLEGRIKSAMIYPALVLTMALSVLGFLITFIVPKFLQIFKEMNVELPVMTKVLLVVSDFAKSKWYIGLALIGLGIMLFNILYRLPATKLLIDKAKLEIPVMGQLVRKIAIARFSRTLGTLLSSGVPILQSLMVAKDTTGNEAMARSIVVVHDAVREGETVAKPLLKAGLFPAMAVNMISVGEETGSLDQMLLKVADVYDEEVDVTVTGLMSVLEPFLIIGLGLIVGFIVIAMFLPLFQLVTALGGG